LAHDYMQQVVSYQAQMLTGVVTDSAERLRRLAKADSIQGAYADQVEYFDVTRERVSRDAKQALQIVVGAGRQVTDLAAQTYAEFVRAPKARAKARTQRGRATARKSGKASVKARARKAA
jgi:phasin family protein